MISTIVSTSVKYFLSQTNNNKNYLNAHSNSPFNLKPVFLAGLLCLLVANTAQAETFAMLLQNARSNEPTYLGAKAALQAAEARSDQAFGTMLPQISVNASTTYNGREYQTRTAGTQAAQDHYNSHSQQLSLTQPIWRYANFISLQQANNVTHQAEQQLANTEQELVTKIVSAWFDMMAARDTELFAMQQVAVTQNQQQIAKRGVALGAISQPELDNAMAKFSQATTDAVSAEIDVNLKQAALEQIVGNLQQPKIAFIKENVDLANLSNETLENLLVTLEASNPNILAATQAYKAAKDEVNKQRAGHQPTLDLVASYGKNSQAVGGFPGQAGYDIKQSAIGLQLNIPVYSGGAQSAKVAEAVANSEKARLDIEVAKRAAVFAIKQAWYGWHAAFDRAQSGEQSIKAAQSAVAFASLAGKNGLKAELELLQAQQQLSAAQRDFRKGRYDQIVNYVKLKSLTMSLTADDISALDALFADTPDDIKQAEAEIKSARLLVLARFVK